MRTGSSEIIDAKFKELSQNFPKLTDGDVHREATLSGRTWGGNFKTGDISFAQPCSSITYFNSQSLTSLDLAVLVYYWDSGWDSDSPLRSSASSGEQRKKCASVDN